MTEIINEKPKRYYIRYNVIFRPSDGNVERWQMYDRECDYLNQLKKGPQPKFEIEVHYDDMEPYSVYAFNEQTKEYSVTGKYTLLDIAIISCFDKYEKQELIEDLCDLRFN